MQTPSDARAWLRYDPERIDPGASAGLWFCGDVLDQSAVEDAIGNAVCPYTLGSWDDLDHCGGFLAAFSRVLVASPDAAWRAQVVAELSERAPMAPITEIVSGYRGSPNLRGFVAKHGAGALLDLLQYGRDVPARGLLDISAVERPPAQKTILSGIDALDRATGGFAPGELTVWTGRRGEGKSTLLSQVALAALDVGQRVFAYSGELPAWHFREWASLQAAGPGNAVGTADPGSRREYGFVSKSIQWYIDEWWRGRFFLYDNARAKANSPEHLLPMMEFAARRNGCTVFVLDNLMSVDLPGVDYYRAQSAFVGQLVEFAKRTGAVVHLCAHPRKTGAGGFTADDVGGSGDISNRADDVFLLERLSAEDAERAGCPSMLTVLKNRSYGVREKIRLCFEPMSRRYYRPGQAPGFSYGWERPTFEPITGGEVPFAADRGE